MKKVRYSFASLVLVAVFCAVSAVVNAQIYINPVGRSYGWPPNSDVAPASLQTNPYSDVNALKIGGTTSAWMKVNTINISSRGVSLFNKTSLLGSYEYTHNGNKFGQLELASLDLTDETKDIELIAGQTLTIDASVDDNGANWGNATIFVDWDSNGSFDDHDPYLYNKYGASSLTNTEYRGAPLSTVVSYKWDIPVPITFTKERYVRIRLRLDEAVVESYWMKQTAINGHNGHTLGIPECTQVQVSETNFQNFWPMCSFRFFPSARGIKGSTLDFMLKIVPDPYATSIQDEEIVVGAGNMGSTCLSTQGTAISDAAGFEAFMSATEGNYYLANDITLTSLPVSQTTFSGTFDGNGHTITFSSAATATFNGTSKDACFFPYGTTDAEISTNLFTKFETETNPTIDMTNYPFRAIAGGFCGVLANGGSIKNVKLVYAADATYQNNATEAPIFGLIAGINKGRIENVSVDVQAGKTVMLQNAGSPVASAFGGITGVLYLGIVKHCAVNIDGTMKHEGASAMQETLTSAFIGRLQAGIVSNVKFSGSGTMYANSAAVANVRNYMGGIAGMTNTPQGEFCGNQDFDKQLKSWGYDNGTVSPDVNNVILSYTGAMNMSSAADNGNYAYHCRGLLFAEAHDTIVVPNLVTQYATVPTIENEAAADASLTSIPLISRTKGICNALINFRGGSSNNATPRLMGDLYLYKDGRRDLTNSEKFTNVNVADAEVDWAYEFDPNTCSYYSTPYAVATYTGTNANVQGIESASANVSDLGSAMVKIDPQPADVASPSWTWSETSSPVTPDTDAPVCGGGGGGGETIAPLLTTYCSSMGRTSEGGTDRGISNISLDGSSVTINEYSSNSQDAYRGMKNNESTAIELTKGTSYTLTVNGAFNWQYISCFADWNADGDFSDSNERIGLFPSTVHQFGGIGAETDYRNITINVPSDAASAYIPLRIKMAYSTNNNETAVGTPDPCTLGLYKEQINQAVAVDVVLKVTGGSGGGNTTTYCAQPTFASHTTGTTATGYLKNLTANGMALATNWNSNQSQNTVGNTITINPGENLNLDFTFQSDWNNGGDDKGLNWTTVFAFVDLNGDGDFTDSGERIYARGGGGCNRATDAILPDGRTGSDATWTGTKTVTLTATSKSMLRIYTIGEYNDGFVGSTNGSKAAFDTGCATGGLNGDNGSNKFHCYDFPIVINVPAAGGDGCAYVANFGNVYVGDVVTYDISLGAGSEVTINADVADDEYALVYNKVTGKLSVTYIVPAALGAVSVDSIGAITKDGDEYRIAVSATVKAAPTVTFRMSDAGGGALSLDMGKTTFIETRELAPYKGELLTAVPVGPTHIVGWYVSTDGGTTFNAVGHTNPDYTYTGADDAIVEVRFDFDDFEGNFGNSRFTDNSNVPFYISAISTTDGIINVNATNVFTDATVAGGSAHLRYMENQRLQTLHKSIEILEHDITVTVQNANKIPADARLMCFVDYNMNNYFDFASSADGLASALSANGELVFVADPNDTEAEQTFTFQISNAGIDKFGKTRMRFMVATYVDMFGLGPVNQYGNYQPRFDTDGDGVADTNLPLNDNNGSLFTPNNQCRLENYVNVADVTFEVVAFVRYNDKYVIKNGESVRMKNLYIEAQEDANGFHAGQIVFDKNAPYGSLIVEGNIIIRRRIYPDKWHDISFPIEMQGVAGKDGICAVGENGALGKLPTTGKHLLYEFNPAGRNQTGGYNGGTTVSSDATFQANKFYEFAADVPDGFTANNAGADIDGVNSYWIQFHSVDTGFTITPSAAKTATLSYIGAAEAEEYNNKNVFTLYNPFLSNINVNEITASLGWENITWWNAIQNRYTGVSAADTRDMPPYFGYWIQFTDDIATGDPVSILLGDASRDDYPYADDRIVNFGIKSASAANTSTFDTPDAYTLGIDHVSKAINKNATSTTIVTLTDAGSVDEFRAGYDMPVSLSNMSSSVIPEIWSKAGTSRMMFNDVMRNNEVVVPVGIRIKEAGEYVVRLTHTNHTASLVQLYDKQTGAKVDLQRNGELFTYSFLAEQGDAERFDLIIIAPNAMTDLDAIESDEELSGATIYNVGNTLRLVNLPLGYTVSICDVVGRELIQTKVVDADMQLQLPNNQGVYLVNVRNENGSSVQVVKLTR